MNIYEITLDEGKINNIDHYVLAKDFPDAVTQASKLLEKAKVDKNWNPEIVSVTKKFEVEVVK